MLPQAKSLTAAGRIAEADALYDRLIKATPRNAALLQSAITFHNRYSRRFRKAVPLVETLVKLKPKAITTHVLAAETLCNCARPFLALPHAEIALKLAPDDANALFIGAVTHMQINRFPKAIAMLEKALAGDPFHVPSRVQMARAKVALGEIAAARAMALELLTARPDNADALAIYVHITNLTPADPIWQALTARDLATYPVEQQVELLRLLGKGHNDMGAHDAAFDAFARAKQLSPARKYSDAAYTQFVSTLRGRVTPAVLTDQGSSPSRQPVLIVGMPRSGSTLLSQFMTSHSQIADAGESPSLNVIVQDIGVGKHDGAALARAISEVPEAAVTRLAARYLSEIAQEPDAPVIIDKNMHNFELLGFFARLFPKAPIIHTLRDPLDTCTSCYMQPLSAWHSYTQTLTGLGRHYLQYQRLMAHWADVLPNPMLTVRYEDLVQDSRATMEQVVGFLGLDWEDAAADHLAGKAVSQTLSSAQVRKPIYQSAIGRWRRYAHRLNDLQQALAPAYDTAPS